MNFFLLKLDRVLHTLYNLSHHIILCGDINIDYLVQSERKKQLDDLLLSFNLTSIITFPTRIQNTSATATDNMFLDPLRLKDHLVTPIYNGLSDHNAQLLTIKTKAYKDPINELRTRRNFNKHTISEFICTLSNESWDMVFNNNNEVVNNMFNSFLNNYIRIFNSSFPIQTVMTKNKSTKNKWITKGIKNSCNTKSELCLTCRQHPNEETK